MLRSEGKSMRTIADVLNVSIGFVWKWCHRLSHQIKLKKKGMLASGIKDAIGSRSRKPDTVHTKKDSEKDVLDIKKKYSWWDLRSWLLCCSLTA